jgi:hypothetical protein
MKNELEEAFEVPDRWSPFLEMIKEGAEDNVKSIAWNDDLMPCLFVEGTIPDNIADYIPGASAPLLKKGTGPGKGLLVIGIADMNPETKPHIANLIFRLCVVTRATSVALLSSVWMSKPVDPDGPHVMPSQDPNRVEKVSIMSCQHGGPDDGSVMVLADIKREEGKPQVLSNWRASKAMDFGGQFFEPMRVGLMLAAKMREYELKGEEGEEWKNQ